MFEFIYFKALIFGLDTVFDMEIVEVEEKSPFFLSNLRVLDTSDGSGTQNMGFGFWNCHGQMGLRQVDLYFS